MKKTILFIQLMMYFVSFVFAQNDYKIHLNTINKTPNINVSTRSQEEFLQGYYIVQFENQLTANQKSNLEQNHVIFHQYIPNYTWLVKLDRVSNLSLHENGARFISVYSKTHKTNLSSDFIGEKEIIVSAFDIQVLKAFFDKKHFSYQAHTKKSLLVSVNQQTLQTILEESSVYFVEEYEGLPQNEDLTNSRGNHLDNVTQRSNYIGFNPEDDLYFNGQNTVISIKEGGAIYEDNILNYHGRATFLDTAATQNSHKTGVAWRVGSAGILNTGEMGAAPAATLYLTNGSLFGKYETQIETMSYGWSCPSAYNSTASNQDKNVMNDEYFMYSYSAGNSGTKNCENGFGTAWNNITGDAKMSKNIFTVGSVNSADVIYGFSSRGPAYDGRIKPEIVTSGGGGTSFATPSFAGFWGQLQSAYLHYYLEKATSDVLKCVTLNSADDLGNIGPDYIYGWGRINARKAHEIIKSNQIITHSISNGETKSHSMNVPAGTKQVKIMVYWHDPAAASNVSKALVNDLDLIVKKGGVAYLPYSINATDSVSVENIATKEADHLNNMEQVVIDNPSAGIYSIDLSGFSIPQDSQKYIVSYYFDDGKPEIIYPLGGNSFNTTDKITIMLDGTEHEETTVFYSLDKITWNSIALVEKNQRTLNWTLPNNIGTGKIYFKATNSLGTDVLNEPVHFFNTPTNLMTKSRCANSFTLSWDNVDGASKYIVFKLGQKFMEAIDTVSFSQFTYKAKSSEQFFMSVAALKDDGTMSVQTNALKVETGVLNCEGVIANFDVSKNIIEIGDTLFLTDLSLNEPSNWSWSSTGGIFSNASAQHPYIVFSNAGIYNFSLTSSNLNFSNTLTKTDYITVLPHENYALNFDGIDEYLQIEQTIDPKIYDEFTMEAWIKPGTGNTGARGILGSKHTTEFYAGFILDIVDNTKIKFGYGPKSWSFRKTTSEILISNIWQHVALIYSKSGGYIRLYLNGVMQSEIVNITENAWSKEQVYIGRSDEAGGYFEGKIDDIRMWGRELKNVEIGYNHCNEVPNTTNLIFASTTNHFNQGEILDPLTGKTAIAHNMETSDWEIADNSTCTVEYLALNKLATTYKTCDSLSINWTTNLIGAGKIELLSSSSNKIVDSWVLTNINESSFSFFLENEKYDLGNYQLKISTENTSTISNTFELISACVISTIKESENENLIYPTILEAGELINIFLQKVDYTLYDMLGQIICTGNTTEKISTENWSSGTYLLHLSNEKGINEKVLILIK